MFSAVKRTFLPILSTLRLFQRGIPKPDQTPQASQRSICIGPANSAGQGYQWARSLERVNASLHAVNMHIYSEDTFKFPADISVHAGFAAFSRTWQKRQYRTLSQYEAVLIESNRGVLGRYQQSDALQQVAMLREQGVKVGLIFHGSDIRDPDLHIASEPYSYFQADHHFTEVMRQSTAKSQELVARSGAQVFVSTVDLLTEVPGATWLPVVIDPSVWRHDVPPLSHHSIPLVVHVPSKSFIKGTDFIDDTLREMDAAGLIRYRRVTGVPHHEMPQLYREADIVLDQFRGGPYGVAACEAMAAGRIVLSHVPHRDRVRELTGEDVPILETSHTDLRQTILDIIEDPAVALDVAAAGPGFVERHHDGARSGNVLNQWLEEGMQ